MSDYKEEIDKMRWSYSRLSCFEHCPYEFYLKYIVKDDEEYPPESNFYAEVGSYVHEILAKVFNNELSLEDAHGYYIDYYDDNVVSTVRQSTMDKTYEACSIYFEDSDFNWIDRYDIIGAEIEIDYQINGYDFVGFIDLLVRDKKDNRLVIIDHKSSKYPFKIDGSIYANAKQDFEGYKKQMYLYAHAVNDRFGEYPKELIWNHFKDGGAFATIPFSKEEYEQTISWAKDTLAKIESETEYPAKTNYFYCKNLCSFRSSCEYCNMSDQRLA